MNGIRQLPIDDKLSLYKGAMRLRKEHGWGKRRIANAIGISENTVKGWLYGGYSTVNGINDFENITCYELGYVIGTEKGDGNTFFDITKGTRGAYMVSLTAKDIDFLNEFNRCICSILKKDKPYATIPQGKGRFRVQCSCKGLYDFLRRSLDTQKQIIEASRESIIGFLRAFFDSEGGPYYKNKELKNNPNVRCYNTDLVILEYIKQLLHQSFDITPTITKLYDDGFVGVDGCIRKAYYQLQIAKYKEILKFHKHIGFSIKRKQDRLMEIVKYLEAKGYNA